MARPARLKLATICAFAVCAASLTGAPSGIAAIATDSGVHTWLFDGSNTVVNNALTEYFKVVPIPFAADELQYLRRITVRSAFRSLFEPR